MGILEPITHKEEIQDLIDEAQNIYDSANRRFEVQKKKTTSSLEHLGKVKVKAWSEGMDAFVSAFGAFKNVEMNRITDTNMHFIGSDEQPEKMLLNIRNASMNANEVARAGIAAIGTGALVGVAAYGGAMMFGAASTGTAIAALSGAAKANATLAWFGGGAKTAGGLGMAGGKLVLAGIVVAPIIAVAAAIAGSKGKERLAEAQKIHAEAENAAAKMNTITAGMRGIARMSDNYTGFITKLNRKFAPFISALEQIRNDHPVDQDGYINFDTLSPVEQKTLHLSWLMAQVYYHVLASPILTSEGEVSDEAADALNTSMKDFREIRKDTFRMIGEDAAVGDIVWKPAANRMLVVSTIAMALFLAIGIWAMGSSVVKGILSIVCIGIACPFFFKFRDLPASRLYLWRIVRLTVAIGAMIVIAVLL